jgi:hypothetical protein
MANEQWPSEDEDFDATTGSSTATATEEPTPAPKAVKVSVAGEESVDEAPAAEPEAPAEAKPAEPAKVNKPEPAPAVVSTPPPSIPKPATVSDTNDSHAGRTVFELLLVVLVIALGLWSWTLYSDRSDLRKQVAALNTNPQVAIQKQTQDLLEKVGKLYNLPSGETPTIANVTDANAAKKQSAFFENAQNGDKVLMYVKAGVAILYRPGTNKIVLVAPLTFTNNDATATTTPTPTATPKH